MPSLVPRPLPKSGRGPGTHCMRMRVISVVTPTGFEEARAELTTQQCPYSVVAAFNRTYLPDLSWQASTASEL